MLSRLFLSTATPFRIYRHIFMETTQRKLSWPLPRGESVVVPAKRQRGARAHTHDRQRRRKGNFYRSLVVWRRYVSSKRRGEPSIEQHGTFLFCPAWINSRRARSKESQHVGEGWKPTGVGGMTEEERGGEREKENRKKYFKHFLFI